MAAEVERDHPELGRQRLEGRRPVEQRGGAQPVHEQQHRCVGAGPGDVAGERYPPLAELDELRIGKRDNGKEGRHEVVRCPHDVHAAPTSPTRRIARI